MTGWLKAVDKTCWSKFAQAIATAWRWQDRMGLFRFFFVIWKLRRRQRDRENSRRWWGIWNFTQSWGWAADQLRIGFEKYLYLEFAKSFLFFVDTCLNVSFGGVVDFSNYCRVNPLNWPFQGIDNIYFVWISPFCRKSFWQLYKVQVKCWKHIKEWTSGPNDWGWGEHP